MKLFRGSKGKSEPRQVSCASCGAVIWEGDIPRSLLMELSVGIDGPRTTTTIRNGNTGELIHECPPKRVAFQVSGGSLKISGARVRGYDAAIEAVDCDTDVEGLDIE